MDMRIALPLSAASLLAACGTLLMSGCATTPAPTAAVPVNIVGCSSNMGGPSIGGGGNGEAILIALALELGFDLGAYGSCEAGKLLHPVPDAIVSDGVYRSGLGTFSVDLPSLPPGTQKPSINIVQPSLLPSDYALFWPMDGELPLKSGAIAYGVGTSIEDKAHLSEPLEQEAEEELHRNSITTNRLGQDESFLLHHEIVTLDGRPARFAVYASDMRPAGTGPEPLHLITYFTRVQTRSAAIVILWKGDCPVCTDGREADIRKLDPNIGRFVDSFHLNETAIKK